MFVVKGTETAAQLRLLLVEPSARGLGIGARLVNESLRFARHAGYSKMTLWTRSGLGAADRVYENAGFQMIRRERHKEWGQGVRPARPGSTTCSRRCGAPFPACPPRYSC